MIQINPDIPVIALTATATPKVQSDIVKNLDLREPNIFISSFNRSNLYYEVLPKIKKSQTDEHIVRFIKGMKNKSGIIYTLNRRTTEELADILMANGIKAVAYHAGLDSKLRSERQDLFLDLYHQWSQDKENQDLKARINQTCEEISQLDPQFKFRIG